AGLSGWSMNSPMGVAIASSLQATNVLKEARAPPRWRRPGSTNLRSRLSGCLLVLGVRLQHEIAHALLCRCVSERAQQRKAAALTVDRVLPRGERDVAATAAAPLPHGKPDQLQAVEHAVGEMQLGIREFAGRVGFVVRNDF